MGALLHLWLMHNVKLCEAKQRASTRKLRGAVPRDLRGVQVLNRQSLKTLKVYGSENFCDCRSGIILFEGTLIN